MKRVILMRNIHQTTMTVLQVLKAVPEARNSDDLLYIQVCSRMNPEALTMPFCQVLARRKELGLPVFESVRRSRQKLQKKHPELAGCEEVEEQRKANEEIVREYARS